ncbi:hypothetical protein GGU10DRAFT_361664 [Lentinula aff. detonsa]|uniref:Uncharacterized protein n=1 Tax=Lentinula aff. detonsa TaxID=2804958 RepID=A0AA38KES8_9AGAR|nr:hypothetical protein GGU10DRAFT_361664 [Lentinula aff. detonsa]
MSSVHAISITSPKYVQTTIINGICPDLALKSSDSILFYVHTNLLNSVSSNKFQGHAYANNGTIVNLIEDSQVLTVILDIMYRRPSAAVDFAPPFSFDILAAAISHLSAYGVDIQALVSLNSDVNALAQPILQALQAHAPTNALPLYVLAAQHNMEALAVAASTYLVGFQLVELTDEQAEAMGPHYLRRLMLMQTQREEALKRILLQPPYPHSSTPECDVLDQKALTRVWALTAASFAWDIRADLPSTALEGLLGQLAGHISCGLCKQSIREQVTRIVAEWEAVKGTI